MLGDLTARVSGGVCGVEWICLGGVVKGSAKVGLRKGVMWRVVTATAGD